MSAIRRLLAVAAIAALGAVLAYGVSLMPPAGDSGNPDKTHVVPRYLERGEEEAGAGNIVTGIILNYRGYDTMGEVTVIFSALCAVVALLGREKGRRSRSRPDGSDVGPSPVGVAVIRFAAPVILMFSVYMMLHGEGSPGGGFQGGAIVGASVVLLAVAMGLPGAAGRLPARARALFESAAVLGFLAMGFVGIAFGLDFLTYLLPGLASGPASLVRSLMLTFIEVGIGVGGGVIFTSVVFSLMDERGGGIEPAGG